VRLSLPLATKLVSSKVIGRKLAKLITVAAVMVGAVAGSTVFAAPAFASPSGDLAAATNASRASAGLPGLQIDGQLSAVAQAWANHLAAANVLSHNGALRGQVSNWTYLGENVGMAADIPSVQQAFMNSPEHRANILNSHYTLMGVGSATSTLPSCNCRVLWVVVDFKRPATAAAPAQPAQPAKPAQPAQPVKQAQPAQPVTHNAQPATPARPAQPVTHNVEPANNQPAAPATEKAPAAPETPSPSASASELGSQLAAAASSPAAVNAGDPVSQLLTFATIMSGLPG
jgi:cysteine-rich secretory family protein